MSGKRANGEGSIYRRADGRWGASAFLETTSGKRKRIHVYGRTRQEAHDRLTEKLAQARKGIRTPDKEWTIGAYLDYWLDNVVTPKNRPRTIELYEACIRRRLKPALGSIRLSKLTVQQLQTFLNEQLAAGVSTRSIHQIRSTLRAALSRAEREELVVRNVAKLVDIPAYRRKPITPWTAEQTLAFLDTARGHRWYGAYLMLLAYGMRRGEVLGLRWRDVDLDQGTIHVQQQLQRIGSKLMAGDVKTEAGRRILPIIAPVRDVLLDLAVQRYADDISHPYDPADDGTNDLIFLSSTGTPIDPKNFVRTFHQIREEAELPRITVHHTRHTAATILKKLGVPARDAQLILGHSHITTTQQIYQHGDIERQAQALERVGQLLTEGVAAKSAANPKFSTGESTISRALTPGGPGGARTLDTLLKSHVFTEVILTSTPNLGHVRMLAYAHILASVAVKNCCKTIPTGRHPGTSLVAEWIYLLHLIRAIEVRLMTLKSFPFTLLPPSPTDQDMKRNETRKEAMT